MSTIRQTSKHKWRREKFWAFVLLGMNRMLYHDPLPPWGFEFLLWVNCQAWWHYTHHGFSARYEPEGWHTQGDGESLSDDASVGERPDRHDAGEEQESRDADPAPSFSEEYVSEGDIPQPHSGPTDQDGRRQNYNPISAPSKDDLERAPRRSIPEFRLPVRGLSSGGVSRCPSSCNFTNTSIRTLRDPCGNEDMSLLPMFDWEEDDLGQYFGDLL